VKEIRDARLLGLFFFLCTKGTIYPSELDKRFHYAAHEEEMHERTDPWIRLPRNDEK